MSAACWATVAQAYAEPAPTDVVPALEKLTFQHQGHSL